MRGSITRLHAQMKEVAEFLRFARNMERLRTRPSPHLRIPTEVASYVASAVWRRHTYAFSIVGIYGAHERFMREFISDAANTIAKIYGSYADLPSKFRRLHEKLSIERSRDILDGRVGEHDDFRLCLSNLHASLDGSMSLNSEVFADSSSNFRWQVVQELVGRLDIELASPEQSETLKGIVVSELNGIYSTISGVVDDLADRRNEVAHGADFDILDSGTIVSILKAVYSFDCWLYREVAQSLMHTAIVKCGTELGHISKTYTSQTTGIRSVASIPEISQSVRVGEKLYLLSRQVSRVVAQSIQKSKEDIDAAMPGGGPFGIDFGVAVKDKARLFKLAPRYAPLATALELALNEAPEPLNFDLFADSSAAAMVDAATAESN